MLTLLTSCKSRVTPPNTYVNATHGVEFTPPSGWATEPPFFTSDTFVQYVAPDDRSALYVGRRTDPIALFGDVSDTFASFILYLNDIYNDFAVITNMQDTLHGMPVMRFDARLTGDAISGACITLGADEYFVLMCAWNGAAIDHGLLEAILQSMRLSGSDAGRQVEKKFMAQLKPLESLDQAFAAVKYAKQLLLVRDVDINNYARAIYTLIRALLTMQNEHPSPPERQDAFNTLMLMRAFQNAKFHELQVTLEQALALHDRDIAMRAADQIMRLYSNDDAPQYRYALKRWKEAVKLSLPQFNQ